MIIETVKLSELHHPEKNIRIHSEKQIKEYARSVKEFEQVKPIVVDENNMILCGNGLFETLKYLGKETAYVSRVTGLTENKKKKLMIADNKIYTLGIDDLDTFNSFLLDLKDDLDIPGYDEEILNAIVAEAAEVTEKISEYGTITDTEIHEINNNKERKEEKLNSISENSAKISETTLQNNFESENITQEVRKSVICPECGCEIWL